MADQPGTCRLCGSTASKRGMVRHLESCLGKQPTDRTQEVIQLRVDCPQRPAYWLDVELKAEAPLSKLDAYLRNVWLECCGHLSQFAIGSMLYVVSKDPEYGSDPRERTMRVRSDRAIGEAGSQFAYEYDFGSTTELRLRVSARDARASRREAVRLLARNLVPECKCATCGAPAVAICPICIWDRYFTACEEHQNAHGDCEDEVWAPIVNSPRMGVCGYGSVW